MSDLNDAANRVMTAPFHARNGKAVSTCKFESLRSMDWFVHYVCTSANDPFLTSPSRLTQNLLQYLARAALWQLDFRELDAARNLIIGKRMSAICSQLLCTECFSGLEDNNGFHDFAPLWIRYSENRHFAHRWMRVNQGLDFAGVNVLPAGDDHVLQTIENVVVSVCVLIADIAGAKEAVPECTLCLARVVPIATHDIRAPRDQLARLPSFDFLPCWIDNTHVDSHTWTPARGEFVFGVLIVFQAGEESGFTQPVDLNEFNLWQNLPGVMHEFRSHWRSAVSQMPKSR